MWDESRIDNTKDSLLRYYTDQQTALSARLIGFVVALFTLIGAVQLSKSEPLFSTFASIPFPYGREIASAINWSIFEFIFLFLLVFTLAFFITRSIFRFSVYGFLSSCLISMKQKDVEETLRKYKDLIDKQSLYWVLHLTTYEEMCSCRKLAYWLFPAKWFVGGGVPKTDVSGNDVKTDTWKGYLVIIIASFSLTVIILGLLW